MLKVKFNEYEIDEKLELLNKVGEVIDILEIKLTPNQFKEIKEIMINKDTIKLAKEITDNDFYDKAEDLSKKAENKIKELIIRDKEKLILENGGEAGLEQVVETIYDFLLMSIMKKSQQRTNTMNINHTKTGNK